MTSFTLKKKAHIIQTLIKKKDKSLLQNLQKQTQLTEVVPS